MKSGMKSKLTACSVAAGAAALGIASSAQALNLGEIGSGIYVEFGPTDGGGNNVGLVSQSWDAWVPSDRWDIVATADVPTNAVAGNPFVGAYSDRILQGPGEGYMLLGLDVYTGEVFTSLDPSEQFGAPGAHTPAPVYTDAAGSPGVDWLRDASLVPNPDYDPADTTGLPQYSQPNMWVPTYGDAQLPTYDATANSRTASDCVWFSSEINWSSDGKANFGSFINVSSDGTIMTNTVGYAAAPTTAVIDDPSNPMTNYTYLWNAGYNGYGYTWDSPQPGNGVGYLGFTMDGIDGWIELGGAGAHRSGVKILSYYFDFVGGGTPGDFDGDGDVDADDLDLLFANVGGTDLAYDLTGDGLVNSADVDEWVFNTVPIGENVGTVYGDFNLDGAVDAGDLALLGTNFGAAGSFGWADGDANGDGVVDAGDLALLGSNFGTVVHPVPEPVTMSLLAIGGAALLRRRK